MVHECVYESSCVVARRRVNDHSRRLVNYKQISVLVNHIDRDVLSLYFKLLRLRNLNNDEIAFAALVLF